MIISLRFNKTLYDANFGKILSISCCEAEKGKIYNELDLRNSKYIKEDYS